MKPRIVLGALALALASCTPPATSSRANLIGTHDLVLVDELQGSLLAGRGANPDGSGFVVGGIPSRFLYVTSADTNELRVLENYRTGIPGRGFSRAPNPLETLSIPVLDRPTMLAVDEGRNGDGARVTGSYVYAARPGGAEVSVVSVARGRQLGGRPMATPAPVTAIGAYLAVTPGPSAIETPLPATTRLFVATWDGEFAAVYSAVLKTDSEEIDHLDFQRHVLIEQTPITAMLVVSPLASRTLDGTPFCDTRACLALSTRSGAGLGGETILVDPEAGRSARLAFVGPVRDLASSSASARIYGILDEQSCGSASCGGVVAVDVVTGTTAAGFPRALDALGLPMRPMRGDEGLITGLALGAGGSVQQTSETQSTDGGTTTLVGLFQQYNELGAFASSTGVITWFSGLGGSIIDVNARRSTIVSASVRIPGLLPDGGESFTGEDGGVLGSNLAAVVDAGPIDLSLTWRTAEVPTPDGGAWYLDLSDGYLDDQSIAFVYQGQIPGLVALPTSAADGVRLATGGLEVRAAVGDLVRFETFDGTSHRDCGRSRVASIGANFLEVAEVPPGCESRVRFSVRADGARPVIVAADLEGYLGRYAPGETLTYSRPYVYLPAEVTQSRAALTVNIPVALPRNEGSFTSFQVQGAMNALQVTLDATDLSCYSLLPGQVVLGNMVMDAVPSSVSNSSDINFRWTLFGVVPSGNGLAEVNQERTRLGALGINDGAFCHR
ncbi:MAG: hypothetical protein Q8L48_44040 [Archangium sp.]|nr:hypothetical protein [Archangium sp.]